MPREIKFRAWDGNTMSAPFGLDSNMCGPVGAMNLWKGQRTIELMQFTGLKDKNGKEIYEGDIVKVDELPYEVQFQQGGFWLDGWDNEYGWPEQTELNVIGNIYENKELLT